MLSLILHPLSFLRYVYRSIYSSFRYFPHSTKHSRYCHSFHNCPWYTLLFLNFISIQVPLTYAIPGKNHVLVKYETQLNAFRQKHYLQSHTSNITCNQTHSQTIIDPPSTITQSSTPVIKHLNNNPFVLSLTLMVNSKLLTHAQTGSSSTIQICSHHSFLQLEV